MQTRNIQPLGVTIVGNNEYLIRLFRGADVSTIVHEPGHVFTLQMEQLVAEGRASEQMQADLAGPYERTSTKLQAPWSGPGYDLTLSQKSL